MRHWKFGPGACAAGRGHHVHHPWLPRELVRPRSRKHPIGRSPTGIQYLEDPESALAMPPLVDHLILEAIKVTLLSHIHQLSAERRPFMFPCSELCRSYHPLKYGSRNRMGFTAAPCIDHPKGESVAGPDSGVYEPFRTVNCSYSIPHVAAPLCQP